MSDDLFLAKNRSDIDVVLDESRKLNGPLFAGSIEKQAVGRSFNEFVTPMNNMVVGNEGRFTYSSHILSSYDRIHQSDHWWISMDHCYSRPWNWKPESTFLRPTKTLFMSKPQPRKHKSTSQNHEEEVDVEGGIEEATSVYDKTKAKSVMDECERHAALARAEDDNDDWENKISKFNWTPTQNRLFNTMVSILNNDRLARLACTNSHNEPIARRVLINKSVERVRKLLATVSWDPKFTQWLHQLMIENLSTQHLTSYLDILQTLKAKVPVFADKMMAAANSSRLSMLSYESLFPLMKKPWDPVASSLMQDKPKKLPGNPIIVVVPSTSISSANKQQRVQKWISLLSNLATVVTIPSNYGSGGHKMTMSNYVDQMFVLTKSKVQDIRSDYPGRNIVLLGFNYGATLALQVAQVEQVLCVICLGFSLMTADGRRGDPDDNLLELQCPVLFVTGQCSNTSLQEEMEDLRERMRVETGLIVVGSADDSLRVNKKKKKAEGITQSVVDRCITDEVGEFISGVILSPFPPQIRQSPTNLTTDSSVTKKLKTERKRYNSNTSSLDSEPPSPTPRITRPVGRPPGSKSKTKWASQGTPSSPSHSPPPTITDTSSNDSFMTDKTLPNTDPPPVKKIKTLKPTLPNPEKLVQNTSPVKSQPSSANTLNLQNRTLSNLLQTDIQTLVQQPSGKPTASGIKVLENVKLGGNAKFFSQTGKSIDMSKLVLNSMKPTSGGSIVLMPDGKIKTMNPNPKVLGGRYIRSKKQLMGNKPPKSMKKSSYMQQSCSLQASDLPPPTNLTTQDIMDLPIIFADDQLIENTPIQAEIKSTVPHLLTTTLQPPPKLTTSTAANKFLLINKQITMQTTPSNFVITPSSAVKKIHPPVPPLQAKMTPKYTKIILSSKKGPVEELKSAATPNVISKISSEISIKKVAPTTTPQQVEVFDLENEIAASTVYKPIVSSDGGKNITIVTSKSGECINEVVPLASESSSLSSSECINEVVPLASEGSSLSTSLDNVEESPEVEGRAPKRGIEETDQAETESPPSKVLKED